MKCLTKTAVVVILMSGSLAACGSDGETSQDGGNKSISLLPGVAADTAYISMECAARETAEKLGYKIDMQAPQKFDATLQRPIVDAAIANKPAAMIIAPTDTSALQESLEQAKADGIKVVLFDTTTEDPAVAVSSVATDNPGVGAAGFEAMAKAHPEGGKVWVIGSAPGISTGDERLKGFEDAVAKNSAFEYVGVQYGGDDTAKSAQLTAAALQKDPDIVGIFGVSYKEAQGAVTAVKQAGLSDKITMVAVDSDPSQVEALEAGDFSALVAQDFESIGVKSVEQAVAAIEGKPVEKKIETGVHLITPENLSTPESQAAIYKSSC